jgi:hypothetical protein
VSASIEAERWCPKRERVFRGEKLIGTLDTEAPVRCPDCGTPGKRLISAR